METERTYVQNQRILRIYSDFTYKDMGLRTNYRIEKQNARFLEEHKFTSCFIYKEFFKNISNICRIIRLFAVDNVNNIIQSPFTFTGIQLMEMCLKKYKLNCAGCSVVLNDILLTLGYKSKCICCIPYDTQNLNTHVMVHVYDGDYERWFVADPAMGRVPCNKKGECMDILALRRYLSEEDELPFYQSGEIIFDREECRKYAKELIDKIVMFIVFRNSGLQHSFEESQIIVPEGINKISELYKASQKTDNAFLLYN